MCSALNPPKNIDRISRDLGNPDVGADGTAQNSSLLEGSRVTGGKSIIGRGGFVHARACDPSQPPIAAAGARVACGVIGIAAEQKAASWASDPCHASLPGTIPDSHAATAVSTDRP